MHFCRLCLWHIRPIHKFCHKVADPPSFASSCAHNLEMAFQGERSSNDQLQNSWPSKLFLKSQGTRLDCSLVKYDASCIWLFSAERKVSQTVSLFLGCFAATPISWFCTDQLQTTQSLLRALWEDKERSAGNGEINSLLHQVTSLSQILFLLALSFCLLHISYLFSGKVCWK